MSIKNYTPIFNTLLAASFIRSSAVLIDKFEDKEDINDTQHALTKGTELTKATRAITYTDKGNNILETNYRYDFQPIKFNNISNFTIKTDKGFPYKKSSLTLNLAGPPDNNDNYILIKDISLVKDEKIQDINFNDNSISTRVVGSDFKNTTEINRIDLTYATLHDSSDPMDPDLILLNSIEAVPEPLSMMTLGAGIATLAKRRKRKNLKKAI